MNKKCSVCTFDYYLTLKEKSILPHTTAFLNTEDNMLSKMGETSAQHAEHKGQSEDSTCVWYLVQEKSQKYKVGGFGLEGEEMVTYFIIIESQFGKMKQFQRQILELGK